MCELRNITLVSKLKVNSPAVSLPLAESPDGGYAPLLGLPRPASLATASTDEDRYIVLYEYTAQVITMKAL